VARPDAGLAANRLRRLYGEAATIVVVDRDESARLEMERVRIGLSTRSTSASRNSIRSCSWARRCLYACCAIVDMFGLTIEDFVPQVQEIITVGEFYERAAGAQIVFT
jgi:peroxiredoxin family protein